MIPPPSPTIVEPPQHITTPVLCRAQLWLVPMLVSTASVNPATGTGTMRFVLLPSPSWLRSFKPSSDERTRGHAPH